MRIRRDPIATLAQLDACTVSDAMDALGLPAAITDISRQAGTGLLVGTVDTVVLTEGTADKSQPRVHLCATAVAAAKPGTVIAISHPGIDAGGWGGLLTHAAQHNGISGVIIDGATRDVDEARARDFSLYAHRTTARTARGRLHESATGVPTTIRGVLVTPGDYVIADDSGVVFIPQDQIESVLDRAIAIDEREEAMITAINKGVAVDQVLGADYENLLSNTID